MRRAPRHSLSQLRHVRRAFPWLVLCALFLAPTVGLITLARFASTVPERMAVEEQAVVGTPSPTTTSDIAALVAVTLGDPVAVVSGELEGAVVTAVFAVLGQDFAAGDRILAVDGIDRVALVGGEPPYRDLAIDSTGPDVEAAEQLLSDLGYLAVTPDEHFDADTEAATRQMQRALGAEETGVLSRSLLVWIPTEEFRVAAVSIAAGVPAPSPGQVLLWGAPEVTSAMLTTPEGSPLALAAPGTLVVDGTELGQVGADGELTDEVFAKLYLAAHDGQRPAEPGGDVTGGGELEFDVTVRISDPELMMSLPSSAVMTSGDGATTCVWVARGPGYYAHEVRVAGGDFGVAYVDGLDGDETVLLNPLQVLSAASCPPN